MSQITTLLSDLAGGRPDAFDELYQLLYAELHQLAHSRVRRAGDLTLLDTTSLVHEAYLRFEQSHAISFRDRRHFLAYAAKVMRSIVVDAVRRRRSERHGGAFVLLGLEEEHASHATETHDLEVLRVHESLEELAAIDERLVRMVEMRYFAGMTEVEIAMALGLAVRTVARDWEKARLFLYATLR
jgi:RNA polymerase sigma factor (TIGR02999 family)